MDNTTNKPLRLFTVLFLLFVFTVVKGQTSDKIIIGKVEKIHSRILNEDRQIWIYNPAEGNSNSKERLPVLYLLDAEDHFYSTVGMVKQMTGRWPAMIVVGIVNTNRNRDLIPTSDNAAISGGGSNFLLFIEKELIPHIDSVYPTAPYRLFSGHSLGGLTVINTLLTNPRLFNAYIAIDPSLWWNNEQLVTQSKKFFSSQKLNGISLFVGRSNNMPPGMDTLTALKDTTEFTQLYRAVTRFIAILNQKNNSGLRWDTKFYPEEVHGTVELNGEYDALKFLFNYYQFNTSVFEINPNMNIDSALAAHFKKISQEMGYTVHPSESLVNDLGHTCMSSKKWDKAEAFFKLNIKNYPLDANCYDSMGDFYSSTGNIKKAIENYEKALTLGNDMGTKRKLEDLKKKSKNK